MHILISDSDIDHRTKLIKFMEEQKHKVTEALTMDEVANICKTKCPDLLIIDINLPGGSGINVVEKIRQLGGLASWNPIILIAPKASKNDFELGLKAGADDFLVKPVDIIKLQYKINSAARLQDLKEDVFSIAHNLVVSTHAAMEVTLAKDKMTGVLDVQSFHQQLEKEWFQAKDSNQPLHLALVNLDNFKEFNNIYGANAGDKCIKNIAELLSKTLTNNNVFIARTIGDNFGIIMPNTNYKDAERIANNIIKNVNELAIPHTGSHASDRLTVSIGLAHADYDDQKTPLELMEACDFALYQAKHRGRNKVFSTANSVKTE